MPNQIHRKRTTSERLTNSLGNYIGLLTQTKGTESLDKRLDAYILMSFVGDLYTESDPKTILEGFVINEEQKGMSEQLEELAKTFSEAIDSSRGVFSTGPSIDLLTSSDPISKTDEQRIIDDILSGNPELIHFSPERTEAKNSLTEAAVEWLYHLLALPRDDKEKRYPDLLEQLSKSPFPCYEPSYVKSVSLNSTLVLSILLIDVIRSKIDLGERKFELLVGIKNRDYTKNWIPKQDYRRIQERQMGWLDYLTDMVNLSQLKQLPSALDRLLYQQPDQENPPEPNTQPKLSKLKQNLEQHMPQAGKSNQLSVALKYHALTISSLQHIMGMERYARLMNSMIVSDGTQLIRFLDQLELPYAYIKKLETFFKGFPSLTIPEEKSQLIQFSNVIRLMSQISEPSSFSKQLDSIFTSSDLGEVKGKYKAILTDLFYTILQQHSSEEESTFDKHLSMDESKLEQFNRLLPYIINGFSSLRDNKPKMKMYVNILIGYFTNHTAFIQSFTDPMTTSKEGGVANDLQGHNINILNELRANGIDVDRMLSYENSHPFNIDDSGEEALDINLAKKRIIKSIRETKNKVIQRKKELKPEKNEKSSEPYTLICRVETALNELLKAVQKTKDLEKAQSNLLSLHKQILEMDDSFREIKEHYQHVMQYLGMFLDEQKKLSKTGQRLFKEPAVKKIKTYSIHQVDKRNPDYLILGDQLSCCLATNASQFPALIERLTDSAMQVHAIYDTETNLPVCGSWLFLAKVKETDEVVLVANFCEIAASIGAYKPKLAKELLHRLMEYTSQYAKDIGAKKFIMRQLTYGMIQDDWIKETCTDKSMSEYNLQKVGGFYGDSYYLVSLDSDIQFHDASNLEPKTEKTQTASLQ